MLILLGSITIWSNELQTAAVTLLAIAAALVIATKELILCIMGSLWRFSTKAYDVGDRIEVGAFRGDVFQYNMFSTKLYEIGPGKDHHQFTGRMIELPNSLLLNTPVINESKTGPYVLHVFRVPFRKSEDWKGAAKLILGMAIEECSEYIEEAKRQFQRNSSKHVIESPNVEPRLHYSFSSSDQVDLVIRIPVPSKQKGRLEQAIIQRYIDAGETREPK
ncbi:mechanosensitive ion channel domain-containing protein [Pseudobacteriovorax antillogorgiicola]|nr:mechanosensitive ion channel domain-containing protein [Pseudobacteriovorax antillogorgiicola]